MEKTITVFWGTRLRGFLRHISTHTENVEFLNSENTYEVSGPVHKLKSKLIRSRLLDPVGLFQILNVSGKNCDYYGSYNRFLQTDKPYFLYLENPTALYHYSLGRLKFAAGKKRFAKCLEDPNLKYIVCMANACRDTFEQINMPLPAHVKMKTIYALVPANPNIDPERIEEKSRNETLECLYCVQGKRFLTKGGLDVLKAINNLRSCGHQIHLTMITRLAELDRKTLKILKNTPGLTLHDFSFSYQELEKIYAKTNVLLQPSADDSCSLTILEAMKGGCAVVASNLYAFPEMVEDGGNGHLMEPKFRIFTKENIPNPKYWKHWKKRWYARKKDPAFVEKIQEAVLDLHLDREKLCRFSERSLELANTKFSEQAICGEWNEVWSTLEGK